MENRLARASASRSSIRAALLLACLLSALSAHAAPTDVCLADRECAKLNDQAARLAAQTSYEQALGLLERAYERFREPRLLVNIGRCHFRLGRARKALSSYQILQQLLPDPEPEIAERLQTFIAEAKEAIAAGAIDKSEPLQEPPPAVPAPPQGDEPPAKPPVDRCLSDAACQKLSDEGAQLAAKTFYDQALVLYLRAYERSQEPRLLVNIGRCYFRMGRATKALASFYQLRRSLPLMETEIETQLSPFITEAKAAATTDQTVVLAGEAPPTSERSDAERDAKGTRLVLNRPLWRVGTGVGLIGLGAVLAAVGGATLAKHGSCVTPSMTDPDLCASMLREDGQRSTLLVDGVTPGVPLLVIGGAAVVAGVVMIALPHRGTKTAWRLPLFGPPMLAH